MKKYLMAITVVAFLLTACEEEPANTGTITERPVGRTVSVPELNADSAYYFVQKQIEFGPRVPNTVAHDRCAAWLVSTLSRYTPNVEVQAATVNAYDGTPLRIQNIIAKFHPEKKRRILLVAHWDTRPFADQDSVDVRKPIEGANDGASGVAVLLEIARQLQKYEPVVGITILLNDAEDYGVPSWDAGVTDNNTYCLGTQYWAKSIQANEYVADYGIVLDMVGSPNARFLQEGHSVRFAPQIVNKVWQQAAQLGYGHYFIYNRTQEIIDDHYYINTLANIPTIDIVDYDMSRSNKGFGHFWHTHQDNIKNISKQTLKAAGQTVLAVIFNEEA